MLSTPLQIQDRNIQCLTQSQAILRSSLVLAGSISYNLSVKLMKGKLYQGLITVKFFALQATDQLFLDFTGKRILGTSFNNSPSFESCWDGNFINLPDVKQGQNSFEIYYENEYDNDGNGLHSFIDSDQNQYLFTQFEIIYCRRVFPCFDQPDLKASLKLQAIAPIDWKVLSNETPILKNQISELNKESSKFANFLLESLLPDSEEYQLSVFPETKPVSSYVFGLNAGPYGEIKCKHSYKNIPMSLYSRQSIFEHLTKMSEFLFEVTNQCLEQFEKIFGVDFPFNKYDQIFLPEFNWAAMENAGIVAIRDIFIFREEVDSVKLTRVANLMAHEMSHHWFGNLVTMKWWNDVWLNESFAEFISHYCISRITVKSKQLSNIWVSFNGCKDWGYRTDEQVTTHPIAGTILDTDMAEAVFDGITYAKGASTIRQLFSLITIEQFTAAMKEYFTKFAYQNTTLSDFITTVDSQIKASGSTFSLSSWQFKWIQTAGLNRCQPIFDPNSTSSESVLEVKQSFTLSMHPTLRTHKMKVAFFDKDANISLVKDFVLLDQESTTLLYDASNSKYSAVLLNYQDETFIKISLDPHSMNFFKENLSKITCDLSKTLIWQAFYNMVRDGELSSEEYIELFINHIEQEKQESLIRSQLSFLETAFGVFTPYKAKAVLGNKIFSFLWKALQNSSEIESNKKLAIISSIPFFAITEYSVRYLIDWYHGKTHSDIPIGVDSQWKIVQAVFSLRSISNEEKQEFFKIQMNKDNSDKVPLYEQQCKALIATPEEKQKIWDSLIDPNDQQSNRVKEFALLGLSFYSSAEESRHYHLKWIENLPFVFKNCKREFFKSFVSYLQPAQEYQDEVFDKALNTLQSQVKDEVLQKVLMECQDNNKRKQKAISTFLSSTKFDFEKEQQN